MPDFHRKMGDKLRSAAEGADTLVWLCISPDVEKQPSGSFFQDRVAVKKHLPLVWTNSSPEDEQKFMDKIAELARSIKF